SVLAGRLWLSTADNNTTNPDATDGSAANWIPLLGTSPAGTIMPSFGSSASQPSGSVLANGQTVGDASSNGSARASADTYWLFCYMWKYTTTQLYNSGG